jgi:hypothetical protein
MKIDQEKFINLYKVRETDPYAYHHPPRVTDAAHVSNFIHIV